MTDSQPTETSRLVDELCVRFEEAWTAADRPRIEEFVVEWPGPDATPLIRELLVLDMDLRQAEGDRFGPEEYCRRFPDLAGYITAAFADELRDTVIPESSDDLDASDAAWQESHTLSLAGRLCVESLHAVGGLGEVYVASDSDLHRKVAVKRIKPKHLNNPDSTRRFQLEAEITGRLEHPGIVPVHGWGRDSEGRPFYVMKFIRGDTLQGRIDSFYQEESRRTRSQNSLEFRKLLNHFVDASQAIGYAHSRRVLHRDIKPGNIMLGKYGETQVVDWGLARIMDEAGKIDENADESMVMASPATDDSSKTAMGEAVGTPAFMSPEQAAGHLNLIDQRTDIYGLGATLYIILTGQRPFSGDIATVLKRVGEGHFERPRQVRRSVPEGLEAICLKAMQRDPGERYQTAEELANDIEAYLDDQPVAAWREPWRLRLQRFLRRRQSLLLGAMLLLAVTATLLVANAYRGEHEARGQADRNAQTANQVAEIFEGLYGGLAVDQKPTVLLGIDHKAEDLLTSARRISNELGETPLVQARLMDTIGEHFAMVGQLKNAEELLLPAWEIRRRHPQNTADLSASCHHLAFLRWCQGRLAKSRELAQQAISLRENEYGKTHEKTLASKILFLLTLSEVPEQSGVALTKSLAARHIRAWYQILESKKKANPGAEADIGGLYTILAMNQVYLGLQGDKQQLLAAFNSYMAANAAYKRSGSKNHPGPLVNKAVQLQLSRVKLPFPVPFKSTTTEEELLKEAFEDSKTVFHGNAMHPGNLVAQMYLASNVSARELRAREFARLLPLAEQVFAGQPRVATFRMELAESLFHKARASNDDGEKQRYLTESEDLLHSAVKGWSETLGPEYWRIAQAYKRLGRIERERNNLRGEEDWIRKALTVFDKSGLRGYQFDHQARRELAENLENQLRLDDAQQLRKERAEIRQQHLSRIDEIVKSVYGPLGDLGAE